MPELPEVNTVQQYFDQTSLNQKITRVKVYDGLVIRNLSDDHFIDRLTGAHFTGSYRRGKFLFAELHNGHHLQIHLGMTGDLKYYSDPEDAPKFERFVFLFENGYRLGFDCPRKLARIVYIENLDAYLRETGLGEDAQRIDRESFLELIEGKKGNLKGFLMNQKYIAGVGNLYADEICYQTRVHPASTLGNIPREKRMEIYDKMQDIFAFAVDQNAHYRRYPDDWLWKWREVGKSGPEGIGVVEKMKIAGRSTYFVKDWQALY